MLKIPTSMKSDTCMKNSPPFLAKLLLLRLRGVFAGIFHKALVDDKT
jgi:hypothetical protein